MGQTPISFTITNETIYDQVYSWMLSGEYRRGNLLLAAEFWEAKNEITNTIIGLPVPPMPPSVEPNQAYYAQIAYRFNDWFQLSSYYAEFFRDKNDKDGRNMVARGRPAWDAWDKDLAVTARFDFTRNWLLKLEAHFHDGGGILNTSIENPDGTEKDWTALFGRFTFYF
jgi:predicted porin